MNSRVLGLRVASAVFGLIFLGHMIRLAMRIGVQIGSHPVPLWPSAIAVVALGALCLWLWRLSLEPSKSAETPRAT